MLEQQEQPYDQLTKDLTLLIKELLKVKAFILYFCFY